MAQSRSRPAGIDESSGFCKSTSIFHSKRVFVPLPPNQSLDITTFISSQPHHGNIALVNAATGSRIGFPELWRSVDCVSACLSAMGIRKGQVILLLSPNSVFFPVVCFSVMSLGAIVTVANPLNTAGEISGQILDSNPVLAFTTRRFVPKLSGALGSSLSVVLMDEERVSSTPEFKILRGRLDEERMTSVCGVKIVGTLAEMMGREPNRVRVSNRIDQHDTAAIFYSSGTTGPSKGVMLSHRNLIYFVETYKLRFEPKQTTICTIPMFHIFGFASFIIGHMALGSTVVVFPKFEIREMLFAVDRHRATLVSVVPPILVAMMNGGDQTKTRYDLSSLKSVACGGAPLSKEVIEGFVEKYPTVKILQGYGLTESTAVAASTNTSEEGKKYGTVGLLAPRMEAKIVESDTGRVMGVNQTGELWLRGPSIMKGYFRNEEATASAIDSEGWLRTGDLCYFDSQGFLFVVDRLKELIKYKGYQVPPAELEALLHTHPRIADAAVIPFPDKEVGQYPMACVVRKAGSDLSEKVVMDFVAKQVAPYKRIRKVLFLDSIPRNASGKILRKDLMKLRTSRL